MTNNTVPESSEYENCLDVLNTKSPLGGEASLDAFFEGEVQVAADKDWKKHWVGMPEFNQEDKKTHKTIYVHFRNEEDYQEFAKLVGQNMTNKTKSIWYPALAKTENTLLRWVEEE